MATFSVSGIDELSQAFGRIEDIPWDVTEKCLNSMAEVAARKVKAQGESMGVRDPESNVHILDKLKTNKAKKTTGGGRQDITFSGSRTRNGRKTRNAEIAFINEYGKRGQPARPFIGTAMANNEKEIADSGLDVLESWIMKEF